MRHIIPPDTRWGCHCAGHVVPSQRMYPFQRRHCHMIIRFAHFLRPQNKSLSQTIIIEMGVAVAISAAMGGAARVRTQRLRRPCLVRIQSLVSALWLIGNNFAFIHLASFSPAQPFSAQPSPGTSATVSFKNFSRGFHVIHVNMSDSYRAVITFFLCFNFTVYFIQMVHNWGIKSNITIAALGEVCTEQPVVVSLHRGNQGLSKMCAICRVPKLWHWCIDEYPIIWEISY